MPYCVDTSGWLDGWQRHYPPDVFPTLWAKIDALVTAGEIISGAFQINSPHKVVDVRVVGSGDASDGVDAEVSNAHRAEIARAGLTRID